MRSISKSTNARVTVMPLDAVGSTASDRVVQLEGTADECSAAFRAVHEKSDTQARENAAAEGGADGAGGGDEAVVPFKMLLRNEHIGHVIGKGGTKISKLSADSGSRISINRPEMVPGPETLRIITVEGTSLALLAAFKLLVSVVEKIMIESTTAELYAGAFPSLGGSAVTDRERNIVLVPEALIGAVIGKGGSHAQTIAEKSGARIHIETRAEKEVRVAEEDEEEDDAAAPSERYVIVIGTPEQQFKAQHRIYELMAADDARRGEGGRGGGGGGRGPRRIKIHFHVPVSVLGSVIGKGGSKINEIATISGAKLNLIRWDDERPDDDVVVEIIGTFTAVQAAQNFIRQVVLDKQVRELRGGGGDTRRGRGGRGRSGGRNGPARGNDNGGDADSTPVVAVRSPEAS